MVKMTLGIEGMQCGMCESHINDAIRRAFPVKKVKSSHKKNRTELVAEEPLSEDELKKVIDQTGYFLTSVQTEPYQKKFFI
ncbi:MAG: heavy-metal-associated domain-containing protein [Clostridiaceae bacterium]|nr:heavy-metal-associated domain-containing protein [Clostridiaceae bacterium]